MKKLLIKRLGSILLAWVMIFTSLGLPDATVYAATNNTYAVKSVTLKIGSQNVSKKTYKMTKGTSRTLKVTVKPVASKQSISYQSSNKKIVTVSAKGKLTAKKAGTAKVTVTVVGKNRSKKKIWVKIKVSNSKEENTDTSDDNTADTPNDDAEASEDTTTSSDDNNASGGGASGNTSSGDSSSNNNMTNDILLETGQTYELVTQNSNVANLLFSSSNERVATVDKGVIRAYTAGEADISVIKGNSKDTYHVTVTDPTTSLSKESIVLTVGEVEKLQLFNTSQKPQWSSNDERIASVDQNGNVNAQSVGRATIYAKIEQKSFTCVVLVKKAETENNATVTRGEWIHELLSELNLVSTFSSEDEMVRYYADTEGTTYGNEAEYAKVLGILPEEPPYNVPEFDGDAPASREFVAVTAVNALGFDSSDNSSLEASDAIEAKYPAQDAIALNQGMLFLDNEKFLPSQDITMSEAEQVLSVVDSINSSVNLSEKIEKIEYVKGVIVDELAKVPYVISENTDGTYTALLYQYQGKMLVGDVILLPASEAYTYGFPLCVNSVEKNINGDMIVNGQIPENIYDVISNVRYSGGGKIDGAKAISLMDEVELTYDPEGTISDDSDLRLLSAGTLKRAAGISTSIPGKLTFNFGEGIKLSDKAKISGKLEVEVKNITAQADIDFGWLNGIDVKEFTMSATPKFKLNGELKYTVTESQMAENTVGSKEIGRLPVELGAGFSGNLVLSIYWDINGSIGVSYTLAPTVGIQIKNGNFRWLGNAEQDFSLPKLEGSAELDAKIGIYLSFFEVWDLIGADVKIGPKVTASLTEHANMGLLCINAAVFLGLKAELDSETIIGELLKDKLHYTLEKIFWKDDNSPLRLRIHVELDHNTQEWKRVEVCSAQVGSLDGYVTDSAGNKLENAQVLVTTKDGSVVMKKVFTDSRGYYKAKDIPQGSYQIIVTKTGFEQLSCAVVDVNTDVCAQVDTIIMNTRNASGDGTVCGTITDALTNQEISSAKYVVYKNWYNDNLNDMVSNGVLSGEYSIDLPVGNYTIEFSADNYAKYPVNVSVSPGQTIIKNIVLSPNSGNDNSDDSVSASEIRVVLRWGDKPEDLDSHLFGPNGEGGTFHTYYRSQKYGEKAELDRDDTKGNGFETMTIHKMEDMGMYSYYVHDYTNKSESYSDEMSYSSAQVIIYVDSKYYKTLNIPMGADGTVWHVFDYNAETKTFKIINAMSYSSDEDTLGR